MKKLTARERARIERAVENGKTNAGWTRGRFFVFLVLAAAQALLYAGIAVSVAYRSFAGAALQAIVGGFAVATVCYILNKSERPFTKTGWILLILLFPAVGVPTYLLYGDGRATRGMRARIERAEKAISEAEKAFFKESVPFSGKTREDGLRVYLEKIAGAAAYTDGEITYYGDGAKLFAAMQEAIEGAEQFILAEYFIIKQGKLWTEFLKRLLERAACGVQVRILYDDFGCINSLPSRYAEYLESLHENVRCIAFNRVSPVLALRINNRDHRKMLIVDGKTAFTGGINLADEYIGEELRFGVWKDSGVRVCGGAVNGFTKSFFKLWNAFYPISEDVTAYFVEAEREKKENAGALIQPFDDSPLDKVGVGETVYADLIHRAEKYAYIFTPYLVLDEYLRGALCYAAARGVDVRIVTPGIPDKKTVYRLTRANYSALLRAGVKIYEYTPGFMHAKSVVCDGKYAVVGTINFDYRSLYHHFENGVYFTDKEAVAALERDCEETFALSALCTEEGLKRGFFGKLTDWVLRIFETLL